VRSCIPPPPLARLVPPWLPVFVFLRARGCGRLPPRGGGRGALGWFMGWPNQMESLCRWGPCTGLCSAQVACSGC
jgi:hypothetical protein